MKKIFLLILLSLLMFLPLPDVQAQKVVVSTTEARSSGYKSLQSAVTAIGAAKKRLTVDRDESVTAQLNIPANVTLAFVNSAKITKSGAGKIVCAGSCLDNAMSESVLFSNFAVGDLSFTGAKYPSRLSTAIFENANASTRINIADRALLGKPAEIYATAGQLAEEVLITSDHVLRLGLGDFPNSVSGNYLTAFTLSSRTKIVGAGIGLTVLHETTSGNTTDIGVIYSSSVKVSGAYGANDNISVSDLTILGEPSQPTNQAQSAIFLGNVTNGRIERVHIKGVHGFGIYVGGNGDTGNTARNCFITDSVFDGIGTQNVGSINSDGLTISGNQFINGGQVSSNYSYYIDLEPNGAGLMQNLIVSNNLFEGTKNPAFYNTRSLHAVAINAAGIDKVRNVLITGNIIKGINLGADLSNAEGFFTGFTLQGIENITITNNQITGLKQSAFLITDVSSLFANNNSITMVGQFYSIPAFLARGLTNSIIRDNDFGLTRVAANGETAQNNGFSKLISEQGQTMGVSVVTTGGVSTVAVADGDKTVYDWYVGKTINLAGGGGITAGNYTVATVNHNARTLTLTTPAGAGNGTLTTIFGNNRYITNLDATYDFQPGSVSQILNIQSPPQMVYSVFLAGALTTTYDVGIANFPSGIKTISYMYKAKVRGSGCTTLPVIRVSTTGVYDNDYASQDVTLDVSDAGYFYPAGLNIPDGATLIKVRLITAAAGCTVNPSDVNFTMSYTQ